MCSRLTAILMRKENLQRPNGSAAEKQNPAVDQNMPIVAGNPRRKPIVPRRPNAIAPEKSIATYDPRSDVIAIAVAPYSGTLNDLLNNETIKHLEKAQVLLRSFRNTTASSDQGTFDIAFEKKQSRQLLNQNILLRRSAEAKGNLPTEELLGSLEPFLLDIANLPDKPAQEDIYSIKERMKKREIVASLQVNWRGPRRPLINFCY